MIKQVKIKKFKSVVDLTLPLGRFNILIGENGCGKSNILEAISYGVAASLDKIDNIYLEARGIRVADPRFMVSAFEENLKGINVSFDTSLEGLKVSTYSINPDSRKVTRVSRSAYIPGLKDKIEISSNDDTIISEIEAILKKTFEDSETVDEITASARKRGQSDNAAESGDFLFKSFMFYCPEESALRTFRDDIQMLPFGVKGNGLFKYLRDLAQTEEGKQTIEEINKNLCLLDWFDTIDIPASSMSGDYTVNVRDKYISDTLKYFDQRSTNEGFLYLLFYLTLFISKDTPRFFAIDNIESSFNPKMCTKIMRVLIDLAKKHEKQVIVTTHSPFILDGLDLSDEEQKLFVVRRNDEGHTKIKEIEYKAERKMKLSDVWMSGAIGGLPDNF